MIHHPICRPSPPPPPPECCKVLHQIPKRKCALRGADSLTTNTTVILVIRGRSSGEDQWHWSAFGRILSLAGGAKALEPTRSPSLASISQPSDTSVCNIPKRDTHDFDIELLGQTSSVVMLSSPPLTCCLVYILLLLPGVSWPLICHPCQTPLPTHLSSSETPIHPLCQRHHASIRKSSVVMMPRTPCPLRSIRAPISPQTLEALLVLSPFNVDTIEHNALVASALPCCDAQTLPTACRRNYPLDLDVRSQSAYTNARGSLHTPSRAPSLWTPVVMVLHTLGR